MLAAKNQPQESQPRERHRWIRTHNQKPKNQ